MVLCEDCTERFMEEGYESLQNCNPKCPAGSGLTLLEE